MESVSLQEIMGSGRVTEGHRYANVSISGVNSGYQSANHLTMLGGRFIGDKDNKGVKNVAVVSDRLVNNMFGQGKIRWARRSRSTAARSSTPSPSSVSINMSRMR